jgi:hypothetical protein
VPFFCLFLIYLNFREPRKGEARGGKLENGIQVWEFAGKMSEHQEHLNGFSNSFIVFQGTFYKTTFADERKNRTNSMKTFEMLLKLFKIQLLT